jgi:hypothetical protein
MNKIKLQILRTFLFAHRGCDVVEYVKGQEIETDDADLIQTCKAEGWARPPGGKNKGDAPENKGSSGAKGGTGGEAANAGGGASGTGNAGTDGTDAAAGTAGDEAKKA